jgi:Protein of unknown function (DUF2938)
MLEVTMNAMYQMLHVAAVGAGATAVMDAWLAALARMGVRTLDMALVGRWLGHLARGTFAHDAIAKATAIPRERALGWLAHYGIGIAFATLLVASAGSEWLAQPALAPALAVGIGTVVAPLLVVQPAMGAGFFASRTPSPLRNCLRSVATHAVFGAGLYLTAVLISFFNQ